LREHLVDQGVAGLAALRHRAMRLLDGLGAFNGRSGGLLDQAPLVLGNQAFDRGGEVVGSGRGALSGLLPVGFPGPPSEPGVRLSPHRALHEIMPL
jgi:hypothetical protein